ncbi:Type I secretion system membrane fusion protein PrsE [Falsiruegeria litorea R37]|uniref:Membrane fusion protein (MFP) family protein n=1 Tax=Falsiruegeria litorea R37 TaxID=1200284 RepID=A0A1Y5TXX0_9RHOB|nr:HlyD family type I secretion periplasmic adaptor subunit [Falsiruegeria litorea]SLN73458.1 Type I secretion system membrane fusion protein PrsE [Falsiruegeria litorea R37]
MTRELTPKPPQSVLVLEDYNRIQTRKLGSGITGFVCLGAFVVAGFLGGAAYWATASKLDGAVVAPASFVVEGNRKTVEHIDGGIVRDIRVSNGDQVEAGQVLLELDNTDLGVELDVITSQIRDLSVRRARLLAQLQGAETFDQSDVANTLRVPLDRTTWLSAYATQKLLFDAEKRSRTAENALTEQRVSSLEDQMRGLQAQRASNARQLDIVRQELGNLETLLDKGLIAISRVNARRVEVERLTGVDAVLHAQEAQSRNEISALRLTSIATQTARDEAASTELAQIEASLATLEPQYTGAVERLKRVAIVAPVSGRVVEMTVFTPGGVVRAGAPILDIVPNDEPLIVEARVDTADIEKLYVGQSSRVRLSAFDQGDVPEAQGTIVDISADSLEDERTGQFYYVTRVKLDAEQTTDVAALDLVPGMPADLFVNTGERTALSYLTQPLSDRLARTFTE